MAILNKTLWIKLKYFSKYRIISYIEMASLYYYLFYFLQNSLNPRKFESLKVLKKSCIRICWIKIKIFFIIKKYNSVYHSNKRRWLKEMIK